MAGLAGLKKDIDRVRADTNQSVMELRGLLGEWDLGNCPEMEAWQSRCIAPIHGNDSHCSLSCFQTVPGSPALRAGSLLKASVTTSPPTPSHGMKPESSAKRITLTWSSSVAWMSR